MEMNHRACSSMFSKLRLKTVYTLSSISNLWFYDIIMWDFAIIPFTITLNLIATQILINRRIPWMQLPFTTVKCAPKHATPKHVSVASECERNQKQWWAMRSNPCEIPAAAIRFELSLIQLECQVGRLEVERHHLAASVPKYLWQEVTAIHARSLRVYSRDLPLIVTMDEQ